MTSSTWFPGLRALARFPGGLRRRSGTGCSPLSSWRQASSFCGVIHHFEIRGCGVRPEKRISLRRPPLEIRIFGLTPIHRRFRML